MLANSLWKKPKTDITSEGKLLIRQWHFWTGWKPSGWAVVWKNMQLLLLPVMLGN